MIELSVDSLHLIYGDNHVLRGVSMQLRQGEVVSLLGPSGSGKTTLLRAVAGLEKPSEGRIRIGDTTLFDSLSGVELPAEDRNLGLIFQSYALWPHKTVFDSVAYPLKLRHISVAERKARVQQVLDQLGLGHLGQRHPYQLSGGGNNSGSPSAGRWCITRRSFCWMNHCPTWTPNCAGLS